MGEKYRKQPHADGCSFRILSKCLVEDIDLVVIHKYFPYNQVVKKHLNDHSKRTIDILGKFKIYPTQFERYIQDFIRHDNFSTIFSKTFICRDLSLERQ